MLIFVGSVFHFVASVVEVVASVVDVDTCVVVVVQSFVAVASVVTFFSADAVYKSAVNKSISQATESCGLRVRQLVTILR